MSIILSAFSSRPSSSSTSSSRSTRHRPYNSMDSIYSIVFGLGVRSIVDYACKHNVKIAGPLIGLWEGIITLHFMKRMPSSFDPYIAWAVRMFIDHLVSESVFKLVLVVIWTCLGMVLADVAPALWFDTGMHRPWRRIRRDLYTLYNMTPNVPAFSKTRVVRFSHSRHSIIDTPMTSFPEIDIEERTTVASDTNPPESDIMERTEPTSVTRKRVAQSHRSSKLNTPSEATSTRTRDREHRRRPSMFTSSSASVPASAVGTRRATVYAEPASETDDTGSSYTGGDLDSDNLSSVQSSESPQHEDWDLESSIESAPEIDVEEAIATAAQEEAAAKAIKKDEEGESTPRARPMVFPPTPSDSNARWDISYNARDEHSGLPPASSLQQIPDDLQDYDHVARSAGLGLNMVAEESDREVQSDRDIPPPTPAKDDLPLKYRSSAVSMASVGIQHTPSGSTDNSLGLETPVLEVAEGMGGLSSDWTSEAARTAPAAAASGASPSSSPTAYASPTQTFVAGPSSAIPQLPTMDLLNVNVPRPEEEEDDMYLDEETSRSRIAEHMAREQEDEKKDYAALLQQLREQEEVEAEKKRKAEEEAEAERQRLEEEERAAEAQRQAEEAERQRREEEARRLAEEEEAERVRLAQEEAERAWLAEERRLAEEAEKARLAEEKRVAEEEAEKARQALAEERRRAEEAAERARLAEEEADRVRQALVEEKRRSEEAAERARIAEEEAERVRLAEAKRIADEAAERSRLADEEAERELLAVAEAKRIADEEAEKARVEEEAKRRAQEEEQERQRQEEQRLRDLAEEEEQKRLAAEEEQKRLAEEEEQKRLAEELARIAAEEKQKRLAEEQARIAAEEEQKRLAEEQARIAAEEEQRRVAEEEARIAAEEEKKKRVAEEKKAAKKKKAEKKQRKKEEEEARLRAEEERAAQEAEEHRLAEEKRQAEEQARLEEAAEQLRAAAAKREAEEAAAAAEEKRLAEEAAAAAALQKQLEEEEAAKRAAEEEAKRVAEEEAEKARVAEEVEKARLAEEAAAEERRLEEEAEAARLKMEQEAEEERARQEAAAQAAAAAEEEAKRVEAERLAKEQEKPLPAEPSPAESAAESGTPTQVLVQLATPTLSAAPLEGEEEAGDDNDALAGASDIGSVATQYTEVSLDVKSRLQKTVLRRAQKIELEDQLKAIRVDPAANPSTIQGLEKVLGKYQKKIQRLYEDSTRLSTYWEGPQDTYTLKLGTMIPEVEERVRDALLFHLKPETKGFKFVVVIPPGKGPGVQRMKNAVVSLVKDELNILPVPDPNNGKILTVEITNDEFEEWVLDFRQRSVRGD